MLCASAFPENMPPPILATVATRSHLAYVRVLARSLRERHPDWRCVALVVDEPEAGRASEPGLFEAVSIGSLGIADFRAFCFQYDAFELCNALKPYLIRHLLRSHPGFPVLYADSDIAAFSSLEPLAALLGVHDVVITPHTTVEYPDDGFAPALRDQMLAGHFNAGVVGVGAGPGGLAFADWWAEKLRHDALAEPSDGLFVDQKFLDVVPCLFPGAHVLRDDGVNVAHFNLHSRRLTRRDGCWWVNEVPLVLFHFTMVRPHHGDFRPFVTRPLLAAQPVLRELFLDYGRRLAAAGLDECSRQPFGLGTLADGRPISKATRRAFRGEFQRGNGSADPYSDPRWMRFEAEHHATVAARNRLDQWLRWPRAMGRTSRAKAEQLAVALAKRRRGGAVGPARPAP